MSRLRIGLLIAVVVGIAAVALAIALTTRWTPEQLRVEAERRLSDALHSEVRVGAVSFKLGIGIHLEAQDVRLWAGQDGSGLAVARVAIGIEPLSLLLGEIRPRRMLLDGATLHIVEDADGHWSPPFEFLDPDPARAERTPDEEILLVLNGLEEGLRVLLEEPHLADALRVRDAVVTLSMEGRAASANGGDPLALRLDLEDGSLRHRLLTGSAELSLTGTLSGPAGPLGRIEWQTVRDRNEVLDLQVRVDAPSLGTLDAWVQRLLPRARLSGQLLGSASVVWPKPGVSRIELSAGVSDFAARAPEGELDLGALAAPKAELRAALSVDDERVEFEQLRLAAGDLELALEGRVVRPLSLESDAKLDFSAHAIDVAGLKALAEWLPASARAQIGTPLGRFTAGQLARFELKGAGPVGSWEDFVLGDQAPRAMDLSGDLEATGVSMRLGEEDQIERLALRARLREDRLEVIEARADVDGSPLPTLHLKVDGVSNWFDADPSLRHISSGAQSLVGIPLLWKLFGGGEEDPERERLRAALVLDVETLQYPLFIWPLEDVHAVVESGRQGLKVLLTRGTWGGVPVEGSADWMFEPSREVFVQLTAGAPQASAQLPPSHYAWARGRFVVQPIESSEWHGLSASGGFSADGGTLRLHDVAVDIQPTGTMRGSGSLDLAFADRIPFQLSVEMLGGDVEDLSQRLDVAAGLATGSLSAWGTFDGTLRDDESMLADLSGALELDARDGEIWRKLPPVLSIALASESFNPFASRETIRYASVQTHLDIDDGRMSTESFALDGPDLRVFADGSIDLARPPHEIKADVALFLFRQLDRAIDLIPVLNLLLLGPSENLVAAHFELSGPWDDPNAKLIPLRSLSGGPTGLVLEGVPNIVRKGFKAIGTMFKGKKAPDARPSRPEPFPWES